VAQNTKQQPTVIVRIEQVPVTPHQRAVWEKFWKRLILEVKRSEAVK
jgi:hypothetical protein